MQIIADAIPIELKALPQWVLWRYVDKGGPKPTKPPYQVNGQLASVDDAATWTTFENVQAAISRFDGIGCVLTPEMGIVGFDLDGCVGDDGSVAPWAAKVVTLLNTYTEISPSGHGLRLLAYGDLPAEGRKAGPFECYREGRYLTLTGNVMGEPKPIASRQQVIDQIHRERFPRVYAAKSAPIAPKPANLGDAQLLDKAMNARNGDAFRRLWAGDTSGFQSHSEADLAYCSHLAFWTGGDATAIDRLFRQSGLMRPKWDERHGVETYGQLTIAKALEGLRDTYSPTPALPDPPDRERPVISTNGRHMRDITADSMAALTAANKDKPWLFARGTTIAQLSIGSHGAEADILSQDALRGVLDRIADFVSIDGNGNEKPQRPPLDVVRDVLAMKSSPLPPLNLLAEAPLFLLDGTLLSSPGYHRESGIYLHLNGVASVIHTNMEIEEAVNLITVELLGQFPFTDDGSLAHAVALTVQPFVRMLISGPTPLYLVDAPTRGTGKGLLVETTGIIPTGRTPEVMAMAYGEEELEKRITSILLAGAQHILLDNVRSLKSSPLEAVLTTTLWRGRRLGHSEMVSAPNLATWVATGNNVSISDEMVRRLVPIRLDAQVERPEERTGWRHPHLVAWTKEHRSLLVSACMSIIQAWLDAGMPKGTETMGRFESWAEIMGGILSISGIKGFLSNRERLYTTADSETEEWRSACTAWWDAFEDRAITASDLLEVLKEKHLLLDVWGGRSALAGQQRIGHTLAEQRDRVFGPYIVKGAGRDGHTSSAAYQLVHVSGSLQNHRNPANPAPSQKAVDTQTVDSVVSLVSEPPHPQKL